MKSLSTSLVSVALFVAAASAQITLNTPINPGNQPGAAALQQYTGLTASPFTWSTNITAGTSVSFALTDSTGGTGQTAPVTIQSGPDNSCLTGESTGTSAASGSSTDTAAASSTTATTPATSAGATSGAATSGAATSGTATSAGSTSAASRSTSGSATGSSSASASATGGSNGAIGSAASVGVVGVLSALAAALLA
ncbi:hypothetical protein TRAPUB_12030 [Trametes pubescens]|uniref:Uncharacterized protein n=1 Tax=Trametes pubescens TaxID=154538 RepID=A0A1M2VV83_TRAPU|nr:hypothetical protein TRAPUB_12030 [Trametes pubescens]